MPGTIFNLNANQARIKICALAISDKS